MKNKLNNKGYMLIEIIVASALAFGLAYFIIDLTIKLKNKNDDLLLTTQITTETTIVSNKLMSYIKEDNAKFDCNNINIDKENNTIFYKDKLITKINKNGIIKEDNPNKICKVEKQYIKINIPVEVAQMPDEKFDINIYYEITKRKLINCNDFLNNFEYITNSSKEKTYEWFDDGDGNCRIKFYESGKLVLNGDFKADIFLVGGGGAGCSGTGGGGGYTKTYKNIELSNGEHEINIGSGGTKCKNGEKTWFKNSKLYFADGGGSNENKGGDGGNGGGGEASFVADNIWGGNGGSYGQDGEEGYGWINAEGVDSNQGIGMPGIEGGKGQGTTTCEFGEGTTTSCTKGPDYAYAGGGGGCALGETPHGNPSGRGGIGGGGNASGQYWEYNKNVESGVENTGGGGGGGCTGTDENGGSGIVIIRNAR